jgi:hypothetical protein
MIRGRKCNRRWETRATAKAREMAMAGTVADGAELKVDPVAQAAE